ncbi:MAG: bacterial transcriptional activator domain-containing protein [Nocardioidaceae bacterium]
MEKLQVRLFGPTSVTLADGTLVTDLGGIKPRQIFEMLAVSLGTPVPKERLAEQLWDGAPPRTYLATLESYVSLMRRRLGCGRGRSSAIATTSSGYLLDPALVDVDLDHFRRLVQPTVRSTPASVVSGVERALALVSGTLLSSEPYADWALAERSQFQAEYVTACNRAAEQALLLGDTEKAAGLARRAIASDRISETAWQQLIRSLSAQGATSEAMRAYLDFRTVTVEELGAEPGPASRALYHELLQQQAAEGGSPASTHEVKTILRMLRNALESFPGVDLPRQDDRLAEIAVRLVGAA